jgi:hypothetical protein
MMEERPGSWNVLIATMAALFAISKYIGKRVPHLTAPLFLLARFVTNRYSREIDLMANWIKSKFLFIWNKVRAV